MQSRSMPPQSAPMIAAGKPLEPTQLGELHDKVVSALERARALAGGLEAFAHRVGVGHLVEQPPEEAAEPQSPVNSVTHALHRGALELHDALSHAEAVLRALQSHA